MASGVVTAFDPEAGLGVVLADDGVSYPFHCVAIRDGSRHIDVGAVVDFRAVIRLGRPEATDLGR